MGDRRMLQHIEHDIDPVFDARSEVLVLGTMPSPASREAAFFYGHPRNRFWPVLAALFDEPVPENNAERIDLLLRHHIALWDVLASCDIRGASDASIANARPNDLTRILEVASIEQVFCTGATSARYYRRFCEAACGMSAVQLPSTSPANAAWSMPRLLEAYKPLVESVAEGAFVPPVLSVSEVIALERAIADSGTSLATLMRRAGRFLAFEVRKLLERNGDRALSGQRQVVVFCGSGNNGGDGWVAARYLDRWGIPVCVVTPFAPDEIFADPARSAALDAATDLGKGSALLVNPSMSEIEEALARAPLAIDAMLGTGFAREVVREPLASWIGALNDARCAGTIVVAADVPSGLSAQSGIAVAEAVRADLTVTMIAPKSGLVSATGAAYCGDIRVAPLAYIEPILAQRALA